MYFRRIKKLKKHIIGIKLKSSNIFATPGFLPFLIARMCAVFAMQIQAIVVGWQVYEITNVTCLCRFGTIYPYGPIAALCW